METWDERASCKRALVARATVDALREREAKVQAPVGGSSSTVQSGPERASDFSGSVPPTDRHERHQAPCNLATKKKAQDGRHSGAKLPINDEMRWYGFLPRHVASEGSVLVLRSCFHFCRKEPARTAKPILGSGQVVHGRRKKKKEKKLRFDFVSLILTSRLCSGAN